MENPETRELCGRNVQTENDAESYEKKCSEQQEEIKTWKEIAETSGNNNKLLHQKFSNKMYEMADKNKKLEETANMLKNEILQRAEILSKEKAINQELVESLQFKSEHLNKITNDKNKLEIEVTKLETLLQEQAANYQVSLKEKDEKLDQVTKHLTSKVNYISERQKGIIVTEYDDVLRQVANERDLTYDVFVKTKQLLGIKMKKIEKLEKENSLLLEKNATFQTNNFQSGCKSQNEEVFKTNKQLEEELKLLKNELEVVEQSNANLKTKENDISKQLLKMEEMCQNLQSQLHEKDELLKEMKRITESKEKEEQSQKIKFEQREQQLKEINEINVKLQDQVVKMRKELQSNVSKLESLRIEKDNFKKSAQAKVDIYEKNIKFLNSDKNKLLGQLKHKNNNQGDVKSQLKTIENELEITKHDRDEKIEDILQLRKMSVEMQTFATECQSQQNKLNIENQELRNIAYEAQRKLTSCQGELEEFQSESCKLQEKLIQTERNHNSFIDNMKKVETKLRQDLLELEARNKEATALQYDIMFKRDSAVKVKDAAEKQLECVNIELSKNNMKLKTKANECNKLAEILKDYERVIEKFTEETTKLQKSQSNYKNHIFKLETDSKILKDEISEKKCEYEELHERFKKLKKQYTNSLDSADECFKLKSEHAYLEQQNCDLTERCNFLEEDTLVIKEELTAAENKVKTLKSQKNDIQNSLDELRNENLMLTAKAEQFELLEENKNLLDDKCTYLTSQCVDLNNTILNLEQELSVSVRSFSIIEEKNVSLIRDYKELENELFLLREQKRELEDKLELEGNIRQQLRNEFQELQITEAKLMSDISNISIEKYNIEKLVKEKELDIEKLQEINSELAAKCSDFDEKKMQFSKENSENSTDAIQNLQECATLKKTNEQLMSKLKKYQIKCNKLKQENEKLGVECKEVNSICNELKLYVTAINAKNQEFESLKNSMQKYLGRQQTLAKQRLQKIQAVVDNFSSQAQNGNETMKQINFLLRTCKALETSQPVATKIIKTCQNIKNQIKKEKEENQQGLQLLLLLKSNLFTLNSE